MYRCETSALTLLYNVFEYFFEFFFCVVIGLSLKCVSESDDARNERRRSMIAGPP